MKFKSLTLACLAAAMPLCAAAAAADSPAPFEMDAATLGRLDALLTACAKADAKYQSTYARYRTEMIVFAEGTPQEVRVKGSDTPEYQQARAEMVKAAGKASQEDLARQCRQVIGAQPGARN